MYVFVPCMYSALGGQEMMSVSLGLEIQKFEPPCRSWELNLGLWKSGQCAKLLSYLSSPISLYFVLLFLKTGSSCG